MAVRLVIEQVATEKGFNQSRLQIASGVTPGLMNRYWRGRTESITLDALGKIARALGVQPGDLIIEEKDAEGAA